MFILLTCLAFSFKHYQHMGPELGTGTLIHAFNTDYYFWTSVSQVSLLPFLCVTWLAVLPFAFELEC